MRRAALLLAACVAVLAAGAANLAACGAGADDSPPLPSSPLIHTLGWETSSTQMSTPRQLLSATPLPDGQVLVVGGNPGGAVTTAELYDPAARTWKPAAKPLSPHGYHHAVSLCNGSVLVFGDWNSSAASAHAAEIYAPATDSWTPTGSLSLVHTYGAAVLLASCDVLAIAGYDAENRVELWDHKEGTWTQLVSGLSQVRFFPAVVRLLDGGVLVVGGGVNNFSMWQSFPNVDLYDPAKKTWSLAKSLMQPRRALTATLLPDGRVLAAGGTGNSGASGGAWNTTEIYDPAVNKWSKGPKLGLARSFHTATTLANGAVIIAGGLDGSGSAVPSLEAFFDGAFDALPPGSANRFQHAVAPIEAGRGLLIAGGINEATAEVFRLDALGVPCGSGASCASGSCADGVCCESACGVCRSCALPGLEGRCSARCDDATHALVCADGTGTGTGTNTCGADACVPRDCGRYGCDPASEGCRSRCTSVADCAPGLGCDPSGACVPLPAVAGGDPVTCAMREAGEGTDGRAWWGVGLMAALALLRRRRA